jgi:hypothetical protein
VSPYFTNSTKNVEARWKWKFEHRGYYGACCYCGVSLNLVSRRHDPHAMSLDHIVPKSQGGQVTVYACFGCNAAKHDLSLNEWRMLRWMRTGRVFFHYEIENLTAFLRCLTTHPCMSLILRQI